MHTLSVEPDFHQQSRKVLLEDGKRVKRLSYKGHMMDALVPAGDEGRDKLR